ncbi:MAG: hypothetical protein NC413_13940 [Muribaculum sp.]|nr:hypothetical protein [Muribaculum sp.]
MGRGSGFQTAAEVSAGEDWEGFRGRAAVGCFLIVRGRGLQFAGRL